MTDIAGRCALVTGGGSGIGKALAMALASEGASVIVADIIADNAAAVADEIKRAGGDATSLACDVCDRDAVYRMKAEAVAVAGRPISLLFANAGATSFERITDMSERDVDWIIQVNLMGVVNCVLAFYPDMVEARDGHVFATSSTAGLMPSFVPYHAPYSAAKLGVIGLILNMRYEAAQYGVGCTVLCPGGVQSGMKGNNGRYRPARFGGPTEGEVKIPAEFAAHDNLVFRPADEVADMVLRAIKADRAMVISDASMRTAFMDGYVDMVKQAFDDVAAFDRIVAAKGKS